MSSGGPYLPSKKALDVLFVEQEMNFLSPLSGGSFFGPVPLRCRSHL